MTPQNVEALTRLDMVQSDLYCRIVLMQVEDVAETTFTETDLACYLGLIRAAMVQLGDIRTFDDYPQTRRPDADQSTDSNLQ